MPGSGLAPGEPSENAVARERAGERGAVISVGPTASIASRGRSSFGSQAFFLARLKQIDLTLRTGHERSGPERGDDETVHVEWSDPAQIASIDPVELRDILRDDGVYLAQRAAGLV